MSEFYENSNILNNIVAELQNLPNLIDAASVVKLSNLITASQQGKAFILQAGDCAEAFADCKPNVINKKIKFLQDAANFLAAKINLPVITIGRIAGQFTKPRSWPTETQGSITLPSYRGDLINAATFETQARMHDPLRMLEGYHHAENVLRHIQNKIYTSHEALNLYYETALTRKFQDKWFNLSTHLPWLGARTALPNSPQVTYLSSIANPIGIKISAELYPNDLIAIINKLNPTNLVGKIVLISRLGYQNVAHKLPQLIKIIQDSKLHVAWICDPMHGNTELCNNIKTRNFNKIFAELTQTLHILQQHNSHLSGIHLECTADDVTECLGGACNITPGDLTKAYYSLVDPRLNKSQTLELLDKFTGVL